MFKRTVCAIAVVVGLAGCNLTKGRDDGKVFADEYFAAAQRGDVTAVMSMYDNAFYQKTPKAEWQDSYRRLVTKLGKPQTHSLTNWHVNNVASISGSGSYVTLVYDVQYERAKGVETLELFIPSGGHAGIEGHNFNSAGLLE